MKRAFGAVVIVLAGVGIGGCSLILGIPEDRHVADAGCDVPDGSESEQLLNACTSGACTPFDNRARIAGFDGKVRPLPPHDAGEADLAPPPGDGGMTDGPPPVGVACSSLPNPVYLLGSSGLSLAMKTLAQAISSVATIVYIQDASCNGLDSILTGDTKMQGQAQYWVKNMDTPQACDIEPAGHAADIGLCDVFPETCIPGFTGLPAEVKDFQGPVQVFMFTVPRGSAEFAISAEAAYSVYGFGAGSGVEPWTDEKYIAKRFEKSGNQLVLGAAIGVPPLQWRGDTVVSSSQMVPRLLGYADAKRAIGITSADVADKTDTRNALRTLAYQHYGQKCAFLPDSELGSYDKRNVRDGHYFLWAPIHFYARVKAGVIEDMRVREVMNYLTGAKPLPDPNFDLITAFKSSGLVPSCAMAVGRSREGGALSKYVPHPSCNCYFDKAAPGGNVPQCQVCTKDSECPQARPSCNFGYCETQ